MGVSYLVLEEDRADYIWGELVWEVGGGDEVLPVGVVEETGDLLGGVFIVLEGAFDGLEGG